MKNVKSLLALVLACMMIASMIVVPVSAADVDVWDGTADTSWYSADATTFTLTTAEQLAGLAQLVNGGNTFSGKTVKLGADIQLQSNADMANYATWSTSVAPANVWTPIGWYTSAENQVFQGSFDGQGHTVSGMYVVDTDSSIAGGRASLFGFVKGTAFKNLNITKSYSAAKYCTAILVAYTGGSNAPSFENVNITACKVEGANDGTGFFVGKCGSFTKFSFKNCHAEGELYGKNYIGAFIGYGSGGTVGEVEVINSSCDVQLGTASNRVGQYVGGLFGYLKGSSSMNSFSVTDNTPDDSDAFIVDIMGNQREYAALVAYIGGTAASLFNFDGINVEFTIDGDLANNKSVNTSAIAALIGYLNGAADKITVNNTNVVADVEGAQGVGGMFGRIGKAVNTMSIKNSTSDTTVYGKSIYDGSTAKAYANHNAALLAWTQGTVGTFIIENVAAVLDATSDGGSIGALIGTAGGNVTKLNVKNVFAETTIDSKNNGLGGLFGTARVVNVNITNVIVGADITSTDGRSYVGGIIGDVQTDASGTALPNITIEGSIVDFRYNGDAYYVGGIIGDYDPSNGNGTAGDNGISGSFTLKDSILYADITASEDIGAISGRAYPRNFKVAVENAILDLDLEATLEDEEEKDVGIVIGQIGSEHKISGTIDLKNVYIDGIADGTPYVGVHKLADGTKPPIVSGDRFIANEILFDEETKAEFDAVLAASEAWGKATDNEYYPIGLGYPGHDHIWGPWEINMEVEPMEKTHYCTIITCTASETEIYLPETDACTCRDGGDWTAWRVQFEATCTKDGQAYRLCNECGAQETAVLTAGHVWGGWNTEYCSAVATRTCTRCGEEEEKAVTPNHNAVLWVVTKYASATEAGEEKKICRNCGEIFDTRTIPAYGVPAVPVTPGTTPAVPSVTPTYTDIAGHKYEEDIKAVTKAGLFEGMGDNKFAPETTMTRAMIVTVLARLQNVDVSAYKNTFTDVAADSYYAPFVGWAEAAGITNGMGNGTFAPDEEITREQALTMIARYLKYVGEDMAGNKTGTFTDLNTASAWAADSVAALVKLGIVEFDSTTLRPTADATRAELANFFANLLEVFG